MNTLIAKYNTAGPRYTSYPTVPHWENQAHTPSKWQDSLKNAFWASAKEISVYVHLPYCQSLCTYCGCTTHITRNHSVEESYLKDLAMEWNLYLQTLPQKPILRELHLGGGTPTFFSAENLEKLIEMFIKTAQIPEEKEWSFEGHPNNTTTEHLQRLRQLGFNRVSYGIQDLNEQVQKAINRIQPYEKVVVCVENARKLGYDSINFDLVYGLPLQNTQSIAHTIEKTLKLQPSRLAFYGYAHIPWLKPAQKKLEPFLPSAEQKIQLYQIGKALLTAQGYVDIGMDHFAQKQDSLMKAADAGELHRNFMGYTTQATRLLIGLGISAISDTWTAFSQNEKDLKTYRQKLTRHEFPLHKGHYLNREDLTVRRHILNLMCTYQTSWSDDEIHEFGLGINFDLLDELEQDGLIEIKSNQLKINGLGKPFVRNVCMAFDVRLWKNPSQKPLFSKTI